MSRSQPVLRFLRRSAAPALLASVLLAPLVWFYSIYTDFYRLANPQESLRYGLEVAKAVSAYKASKGHLPMSVGALENLPERPMQLADWTLDGVTGHIRLRVAGAPADADTLDLVPAVGAGGVLAYACRSVNVPQKFSPRECGSVEKR